MPHLDFTRARFPEMYESLLVAPLFRPWAAMLLEKVSLVAGMSLLDVACGTGIVARLAKEKLGRDSRVVGVDLNPPMLAVAAAVAPDIEWRLGSAVALPLDNAETFDVVICQQGLQFFPDKAAAIGEMKRALAPDGVLAIATWRAHDEIPLLRDLHVIAEQRLGPVADQRHSFGDATALEHLLCGAGLRDIHVETLSRTIRFADASAFVRMNATGLVDMSALAPQLDGAERTRLVSAIVNDSAAVIPNYADGDGMAFDMSANVATAR
jgi:ubiquinone/menaquinone biosynthesis C-methylase UbiE